MNLKKYWIMLKKEKHYLKNKFKENKNYFIKKKFLHKKKLKYKFYNYTH